MKKFLFFLFISIPIFAQRLDLLPTVSTIISTDRLLVIPASGLSAKIMTVANWRINYMDTAFVRKTIKQYITGKMIFQDSVTVNKNIYFNRLSYFVNDSLSINGLWYDYPSTRIANSVLYDSLGNGILKWKVFNSLGIDTTKISYLAKIENFTGFKTFNHVNGAKFNYKVTIGDVSGPTSGSLEIVDASGSYITTLTASSGLGAKTLYLPNETGQTIATRNYMQTSGISKNLADGLANQIPYQTAANTTSFITAPSNNQLLNYNSGFGWLSFTSAATASTIVSRNTNGDSYFQNVYLGSASAWGNLFIYDSPSGYYSQLVPTTLTLSNKTSYLPNVNGILISDGGSYSNPSWITSLAETKVLPSQTGNNGKYLTTNGTSTSWATVSSSGITSLNGLTGATQTFTNDVNVTITSSGTAHALGWSGQLSTARGGTNAASFATTNGLVYYDGSKLATTTITTGSLYSAGLFDPTYGELYSASSGTISVTTGYTYYKWTNASAGLYANTTLSAVNDRITINTGYGGIYRVNYSVTFANNNASNDVYFTIYLSGVDIGDKAKTIYNVTDTNYHTISGSFIISLTNGDYVELYGTTSGSSQTITVLYANINVTKISN